MYVYAKGFLYLLRPIGPIEPYRHDKTSTDNAQQPYYTIHKSWEL